MALFEWFSPKPNHPLATLGEMRKVADGMTRREPREAVEEATVWLESLGNADDFTLTLLLARIRAVSDAGAPQVRRLTRDYLAQVPGSAAAARQWDIAWRFWNTLATVCTQAVERHLAGGGNNRLRRDHAAWLYCAALNAWATMQKWQQFRYRQGSARLWSASGHIFASARAAGMARRPVTLQPGLASSHVEAEYLKLLLFHVAAMDTLRPLEVELGERLIAHFLPAFSLSEEIRPGNAYWVDFASGGGAPRRLVNFPDPSPTLLFFSGERAEEAVSALAEQVRAVGEVPPQVNLAGQYPVASVLRVLDHLALCWAKKAPARDHVRRAITAPLAVIHGFHEALHTIAYAASVSRTRIPDLELWAVSDVSMGGLAINGRLGRDPWPGIGVLVTMKPDGDGSWLVGVVRRYSRGAAAGDEAGEGRLAAPQAHSDDAAGSSASLGIETLSRSARSVAATTEGFAVDAIVLDLPVVGETCRLLVPPDAIEPTIPLLFTLDEKSARMMPMETLERGPDYHLVNFFVQSFS